MLSGGSQDAEPWGWPRVRSWGRPQLLILTPRSLLDRAPPNQINTVHLCQNVPFPFPEKKKEGMQLLNLVNVANSSHFPWREIFVRVFYDRGFHLHIDQDIEMSSSFTKSLNYLRKSLWLLPNLIEKIIILNIKNTSTKKFGDDVMFLAVCFHSNFLRKFWTDGIGDLTGDCKLLSGNFIWRFLKYSKCFCCAWV